MNSSNIVAEVGLTYKITVPVDGMQRITTPDAAYELLKSLFDQDTIQLQLTVKGLNDRYEPPKRLDKVANRPETFFTIRKVLSKNSLRLIFFTVKQL